MRVTTWLTKMVTDCRTRMHRFDVWYVSPEPLLDGLSCLEFGGRSESSRAIRFVTCTMLIGSNIIVLNYCKLRARD
jgi:hypothetical protein